jgi:hypothetical protein
MAGDVVSLGQGKVMARCGDSDGTGVGQQEKKCNGYFQLSKDVNSLPKKNPKFNPQLHRFDS